MRKYLILFLISVVIFFGGAIFAEEDTAKLSLMIGTVEFSPAWTDKWEEAKEGIALSAGDKIRTGIDGMATISFTNGSTVTLKQDTEFQVQSLTVAKNQKDIVEDFC